MMLTTNQDSKDEKVMAILLGSHGYFAEEALNSVQMIIGEQKNVGFFSLTETMDLSKMIESVKTSFDSLDKSKGILIFTDIAGGTPSNAATVIKKKNENVRLLTGFNLPLLIEAFLNREKELNELVYYLKEQFQETFLEIK